MAISVNGGVLFVGISVKSALLFGICFGARYLRKPSCQELSLGENNLGCQGFGSKQVHSFLEGPEVSKVPKGSKSYP